MTKTPRAIATVEDNRRLVTEDERDLVKRMRNGDEKAFETFADHYVPGLYRFAAAHLRNDPEQIREVVQTTVCKGIEKLDTFRGESSLFTWLCTMCRNEIAGHYRRRQKRPTVELDEDMTPAAGFPFSPAMDPEALLLEVEIGNLVHVVMDSLTPSYCSALEWKYLDNMSVREIGEKLSLGPKAAESLLTRARRAFRSTYEQLAIGHRGARAGGSDGK